MYVEALMLRVSELPRKTKETPIYNFGVAPLMRNRDPHRENVENILAICLPILTM